MKRNTCALVACVVISLPNAFAMPRLAATHNWTSASSQIELFFTKRDPLWRTAPPATNPIVDRFNVRPEVADSLIRSVHDRMSGSALRPVAGRKLSEISRVIMGQVDAEIMSSKLKVNSFTREWLLAEGVCRWTLLNVFYDKSQVGPDWITKQRFIHFGRPETVLASVPHAATCGGFACVVRDLGRAAGLEAYKVDGHLRSLGNTGSVPQNHSIAAFVIGGVLIPADLSDARESLQNPSSPSLLRRTPEGRVQEWNILPVSVEAWEVFLARFHTWDGIVDGQKLRNWDGDIQGVHAFTDLSLQEWQRRDTSGLESLLGLLRQREFRR